MKLSILMLSLLFALPVAAQSTLPPTCEPFDWFMRSKEKKLFLCEAKNTWAEIPTAMTIIDIAHGGTGKATKKEAFDALSPLAGKGSLLVFDGNGNVALPLCPNGQTLIADSATPLGWKCGTIVLKPIQFTLMFDPATGKMTLVQP